MSSIPRFTPVLFCSLLLIATPKPAPGQEGKGREIVGSVLKAILEAKRHKGQPPVVAAPSGQVDLNLFRGSLADFCQELNVLSSSIQGSGSQDLRSLLPRITQLQERGKFSQAFLSRENQLDAFVQFCTTLDQEWRAISAPVQQFAGADYQVQNSVANLDALLNKMWLNLGRVPQGIAQPTVPTLPGGAMAAGPGAPDAKILFDLLDREITTLYDQISLRELMALPPQQTQRLFDQAVRLSDATDALNREITRHSRTDALATTHRALQQEWTSLAAVVRSERGLGLEACCDRVDNYVTELSELFSASGRFHGSQAPRSATQGSSSFLNLSTKLEVLAGDLAESIRRSSDHFHSDALRSGLLAQSSSFLGSTQNFRRFLMRPPLDRSGQIEAPQLRRSWQETAAAWQQFSTALNQLGQQVRHADRYFPDVFRAQDEIATLVGEIQNGIR